MGSMSVSHLHPLPAVRPVEVVRVPEALHRLKPLQQRRARRVHAGAHGQWRPKLFQHRFIQHGHPRSRPDMDAGGEHLSAAFRLHRDSPDTASEAARRPQAERRRHAGCDDNEHGTSAQRRRSVTAPPVSDTDGKEPADRISCEMKKKDTQMRIRPPCRHCATPRPPPRRVASCARRRARSVTSAPPRPRRAARPQHRAAQHTPW